MIRLFNANDALATALTSQWIEGTTYFGATKKVAAILDQQRLIGAERPPRGCVLMTLHKSKGKEFDGVVIVEGFRGGALLNPDEAPNYETSRRVLRVGISRARHVVRIVRPKDAPPLFQ